jgi:hypothetical protein
MQLGAHVGAPPSFIDGQQAGSTLLHMVPPQEIGGVHGPLTPAMLHTGKSIEPFFTGHISTWQEPPAPHWFSDPRHRAKSLR